VSVEWDLDGSGLFPVQQDVDGTQSAVHLSTSHVYTQPGTHYASARVRSHREGDLTATSRLIENVAQARIVVSETLPEGNA
jgi:hypothetical protein